MASIRIPDWQPGMRKTFTERDARSNGYELVRGNYSGTCDDRIDRWYWDDIHSSVVDRRGDGFRTKEEALYSLYQYLASYSW